VGANRVRCRFFPFFFTTAGPAVGTDWCDTTTTGTSARRRVALAQYRAGIIPSPMMTSWLSQKLVHPSARRVSNP
jgi:hypothetical protein